MARTSARFSFTTNAFVPAALFVAFAVGISIMSRLLITTGRANPEEFRGRVFWGASVVALLITAIWNIGLAIEYIRAHSSARVQRAVFSLTIVSALILGLGRRYAGTEGERLLDTAAAASGVNVRAITAGMNIIAAATIVLLLSAAAIVGAVSNGIAEDLRVRAFHLRVLLISSSLLLAIGVAEIYFLFNWPLQLPKGQLDAVQAAADPVIAHVIPTAAGALYTFLLVLIYAPAAVAHEERVTQLLARIRADDPATDVEKWRKANGLETSVAMSFVSAIAVVTPILTAIGLPKLALK